jgi:putative ABC transport system permease protein
MQKLLQDLRYSIRVILKNPALSSVVVLTLAISIGANTAIFSVVNAVLLRPLPYANPDRLVAVSSTDLRRGNNRGLVSYPDFVDWRARNQVFDRMAAFHNSNFVLTSGDETARYKGAVVSAELFSVVGATAGLGRTFREDEDNPGNHVVLLSGGLWQRSFGSDPSVIGQTIAINHKPYTIVGVMPSGFRFPIQTEPAELWTTFAAEAESTDGTQPTTEKRGDHYLEVIASLKPGMTVGRAQAELENVASSIEKQYPDTNANSGIGVVSLLEKVVGDVRPALLIILAAVLCVLLIACANVANLLLARATVRHKEMAIRAALGASPARILRQLLTESILVSSLGGALGLCLTIWGIGLLIKLSPGNIPRAREISIDVRVLGFTMLISLLTGVVFGLAPALELSKADLTESLKDSSRGSTQGTNRNRVRNALIVFEVAVALVLLVGAGLLIHSFQRLLQVKTGFDAENVLTFKLVLSDTEYSPAQQVEFYRQLLSKIVNLPTVRNASAVNPMPLSGSNIGLVFELEGRPGAKSDRPATDYHSVSLDYFSTMGIPLVSGRDFSARDDMDAPGVVIINETLARRSFPDEDPLGKRIKPSISIGKAGPVMREIVGVVGDVKHRGLNADLTPEVYVPHAQIPFNAMTVVLRTNGDPYGLVPAVRNEVAALNKYVPIYDLKTLDQYLSGSVAAPRFNLVLMAIFAAVALILTTVGLYSVIAYSVAQRRHEIGIRMALGARNADVLKLVIVRAMLLTLIGLTLGLGTAFFSARFMASLLFQVGVADPSTFIAAGFLLMAVALLACFVPARRATKVDPMSSLRGE